MSELKIYGKRKRTELMVSLLLKNRKCGFDEFEVSCMDILLPVIIIIPVAGFH